MSIQTLYVEKVLQDPYLLKRYLNTLRHLHIISMDTWHISNKEVIELINDVLRYGDVVVS